MYAFLVSSLHFFTATFPRRRTSGRAANAVAFFVKATIGMLASKASRAWRTAQYSRSGRGSMMTAVTGGGALPPASSGAAAAQMMRCLGRIAAAGQPQPR